MSCCINMICFKSLIEYSGSNGLDISVDTIIKIEYENSYNFSLTPSQQSLSMFISPDGGSIPNNQWVDFDDFIYSGIEGVDYIIGECDTILSSAGPVGTPFDGYVIAKEPLQLFNGVNITSNTTTSANAPLLSETESLIENDYVVSENGFLEVYYSADILIGNSTSGTGEGAFFLFVNDVYIDNSFRAITGRSIASQTDIDRDTNSITSYISVTAGETVNLKFEGGRVSGNQSITISASKMIISEHALKTFNGIVSGGALSPESAQITSFLSVDLLTPVTILETDPVIPRLIGHLLTESGTPIGNVVENYQVTPGVYVPKIGGGEFTKFLNTATGRIEFPDVVPRAWNLRFVLFGDMVGGGTSAVQQGIATFYIPTVPGGNIILESLFDVPLINFKSTSNVNQFALELSTRTSSTGALITNGIGISYNQTDYDIIITKLTLLIT